MKFIGSLNRWVDQESKFDLLYVSCRFALLSQLFYTRSVPSSNPSLRHIYYKRSVKPFSTFCRNVSTKMFWNWDLGIVKVDLNNNVWLSFYIIQYVDICVWKIIFKLPNNHSVFCDGLIMAIWSSGDHRPHTFAVLRRQLLRHMWRHVV